MNAFTFILKTKHWKRIAAEWNDLWKIPRAIITLQTRFKEHKTKIYPCKEIDTTSIILLHIFSNSHIFNVIMICKFTSLLHSESWKSPFIDPSAFNHILNSHNHESSCKVCSMYSISQWISLFWYHWMQVSYSLYHISDIDNWSGLDIYDDMKRKI